MPNSRPPRAASSVASADELPADLEAVVVFVVNAAQTEDVLFGEPGCLSRLNKGAVILCCATVAPDVGPMHWQAN